MRVIVSSVLAMLLASCNDQPAKPQDVMQRLEAGNLSDDDLQKLTSAFPGMTQACIARTRAGGINAIPKRTEECFEMTPLKRWRGLWRAEYEGSRFCPAPTSKCTYHTLGDHIWLSFREDAPQNELQGRGGLYVMDFYGRRTLHAGMFGHLGGSQHEMIVDRVISMKELEPAQRDMTPAEMEAAKKECEASPNCFTNEEIRALRHKN